LDKIAEREANGLDYKFIYGLDKISVDINTTEVKETAATKTKPHTVTVKTTVTSYFYHKDKNGSTDSLTDTARTVKSSAGYGPWGEPQKSDTLTVDKRKLDLVTEYTTYTYDHALTIYYAKARMYDTENKRFMSQDPVPGYMQIPQTLNLYPYVINNPQTYIDPTGEAIPLLVVFIIVGAIVGAGIGVGVSIYSQATAGGGRANWDWDRVDWGKVFLSGLAGGIGGAFIGASIWAVAAIPGMAAAGALTKTGAVLATMGAHGTMAAGFGISVRSYAASTDARNTAGAIWGAAFDPKNILVDFVSGAVSALPFLGATKIASGLMVTKTAFGTVGKVAIAQGVQIGAGFGGGFSYSVVNQALANGGQVDLSQALMEGGIGAAFAVVFLPGGIRGSIKSVRDGRSLTQQEIKTLKKAVVDEGQMLKDIGMQRVELGPAIAGSYDKQTGKIFTAINDSHGLAPKNISPLLAKRLERMPRRIRESYTRTLGVGSHAEIYAANKALLANPNAKPKDIAIYVNRTLGTTKPVTEIPFVTCPHCRYLLKGFDIISN
jgi:RHS repeat-associated protein